MATLTENATRIKDAADDIKSWIVEQGVTPTGKIETYRTALNSIDIPKVKSGTFTTNTSGTTIPLDFKPVQIWVSTAFDNGTSGAFASTETEIWSATGYFEYYTSTSTAGTKAESVKSTRFPSVTSTGFTHKARYGNKTAYYVAIG